jgi:hypothetical protein
MKAFLYVVTAGTLLLQTFAQATFQLKNLVLEAGVDAPIFDASGVPLAGDTYVAELYGGRTINSLSPGAFPTTNRVRVPFLTGELAGYFDTYQGVGIRDTAGGDTAWLQIRVWDTRLGGSYEEVAARGFGGYGESPVFYARGGDPSHLGPPPQPLIGLQSFRLRATTPAVLMRSIRRQDDQIVVEWNPGFPRYQLQQTASLNQPWQNIGEPTAFTVAAVPVTGPSQFFRVLGFLE